MSRRAELIAKLLHRPAEGEALADPLRPLLASLIVGRALGEGVLPATLGLDAEAFQSLWARYFPGPIWPLTGADPQELPELDDLVQLLLDHRAGRSIAEPWVARILAQGCAGCDHLWQDLGLADRAELSRLMATAFPSLAAANTGDMKWKKFIYRQYCQREGIYVCPAPSCSACIDYPKCFGPEG